MTAMVLICWLITVLFIGIGLFALKMKTPIHFLSGTTVKRETISDVKAYNKANAIMWIAYSFFYLAAGILALLNRITASAAVIGASFFPGLIGLVAAYMLIYKKYRVKQERMKS